MAVVFLGNERELRVHGPCRLRGTCRLHRIPAAFRGRPTELHFAVLPALVWLLLCIQPGCRGTKDEVEPSGRSAGEPVASRAPVGPDSSGRSGGSGTALDERGLEARRGGRACRPSAITVGCVSEESVQWLPEPVVTAQVERAIDRQWPSADRGSLQLTVQYALRFSQDAPVAFIGFGGRLHGPGSMGPVDLEQDSSADLPWESPCSGAASAPEAAPCRARLDEAAGRLVDELVGRLALRCELSACDEELSRRNLASRDDFVRLEAVHSVGDCRFERLAPELLPLAESADLELALAAVVSLGQTRWPGGIAAIVRRSQAADDRIQRAAAQALADIGTEPALRYLNDWARLHPDPAMRELCLELVRSGSGGEPTGQR